MKLEGKHKYNLTINSFKLIDLQKIQQGICFSYNLNLSSINANKNIASTRANATTTSTVFWLAKLGMENQTELIDLFFNAIISN
jgi:hypothetical protein